MSIQPEHIDTLFNPESIAIIGASAEEGKVGNVIAKNLLNPGYQGEVFLVNPKYPELLGKKCYKNLQEIHKKIDLVIISVPSKLVNAIVEEGSDTAKNFVIISSGFSETGQEGREKERELLRTAEKKNLRILGPNCLGFIHPSACLNASFAGGMPPLGNVALISQSGALAVAMMDSAKKEGMGFSRVVSIGNKMQLDEVEMLRYFGQDKKTKVIAMYLEGIQRGKEFMEAARSVDKPIILLKAGKTEKSRKAIASHTGSLAGSDEIISEVCKKTGIVRADTLEDFFNCITLVSQSRVPANNNVAIITNAGGPGVLTTDSFLGKSAQLVEFSDTLKAQLKEFLPEEASVENPVDLLGDAKEDRYAMSLDAMVNNSEAGSVVCILTPQDQTPVEKIAEIIAVCKKNTDKIIAASFIGGERVENARGALAASGVPHFNFPHQAVDAIEKYYTWNITQSEKVNNSEKYISEEKRKESARQITQKAVSEHRNALLFSEAKEIMRMYDIPVIGHYSLDVKEKIPAKIKFPVVVKVDSATVLHKTDKQGVILNVKNNAALREAVEKIRGNFPGEHVVIQPMMEKNIELIAGIKRDEVFGPVILYGLGGIYAELFRKVEYIIPFEPLESIEKKIKNGQFGFLFHGARSQKPYRSRNIAKILYGLQAVALELEEITELDINPLLIYNDEQDDVAVDVKIII